MNERFGQFWGASKRLELHKHLSDDYDDTEEFYCQLGNFERGQGISPNEIYLIALIDSLAANEVLRGNRL